MNDRLMKQVLAKLCGMVDHHHYAGRADIFRGGQRDERDQFSGQRKSFRDCESGRFLVIVGIGQAIVILSGGINLVHGGGDGVLLRALRGDAAEGEQYVHRRAHRVGPADPALATGLLNGIMITKLNIPPFIATFAMMYTCRGWRGCICGTGCFTRSMNRSVRSPWGGCLKSGDLQSRCPMLIAFLALLLFFWLLRLQILEERCILPGRTRWRPNFPGIQTDRLLIIVYIISSDAGGVCRG